jgi:hypothetical protein
MTGRVACRNSLIVFFHEKPIRGNRFSKRNVMPVLATSGISNKVLSAPSWVGLREQNFCPSERK